MNKQQLNDVEYAIHENTERLGMVKQRLMDLKKKFFVNPERFEEINEEIGVYERNIHVLEEMRNSFPAE